MRFAKTRAGAALGIFLLGSMPAFAADRWEEAGSGAVAILPVPRPATSITGGSLYCSLQRWGLMLRLGHETGLAAGSGRMSLAVDEQTVELDATIDRGVAQVDLPRQFLQSLRTGNVLSVELGSAPAVARTSFNLRSSGAVIDSIAPRCSQIDMSAYRRLTLSGDDASVAAAIDLLKDDIRLYRDFSGDSPSVAAAAFGLEGEKRLMFAQLCGSKRYFGDSGCSLSGYAVDSPQGDWRMVYETDGMLLHVDPERSSDGWPDLLTLPPVGGTEPIRWTWTGSRYEAVGEAVSEDQNSAVEEQGDKAEQP